MEKWKTNDYRKEQTRNVKPVTFKVDEELHDLIIWARQTFGRGYADLVRDGLKQILSYRRDHDKSA